MPTPNLQIRVASASEFGYGLYEHRFMTLQQFYDKL